MASRGSIGSLWPKRSRQVAEYVKYDGEPPSEWKGAVRPGSTSREPLATDGIEVVEQAVGAAAVVETHFRIRCECGKRWWAIDLQPTTCPRCQKWVSIRSAD